MGDNNKRSPKRKRRLIAVLVFAVILIGWVVYEVFLSTNATIRRAEAFLFGRMTAVQLEKAHYRYFFVSNRRIEPSDDPIEDRVTTERDEKLAFGSYDIRLSPMLGLGVSVRHTGNEIPDDLLRFVLLEVFIIFSI